MVANSVENDYGPIISRLLSDAEGTVYVVEPTAAALHALIDTATASSEPLPTLRVLADEEVYKDIRREFLIASRAADLIDDDTLELRTTTPEQGNHLYVTDSTVYAVVGAGPQFALLSSDDEEFVAAALERCDSQWAEGSSFDLRTPPRSRVDDTLRSDISPAVADSFANVLDSVKAVRGDDELDEVAISLLVAAKHEVLLYDISKWGEDVGLASKATFSRVKNKLEDYGLLDTEKVPMDIGRPRLRLLLGDDRLNEATPDELINVAYGMLQN
jgi:hypothetical protein